MLLFKHKILADLISRLLTPNPQLCPREVKPKPECRELSQLLNLSTHPQHYPLKINHAGKPLSKTLASYVSTHAPHSAGSSLETSPPLFQEADVRMAAIKHDASLGNVETITLTGKIWKRGERWCIFSCPELVNVTQHHQTHLSSAT